MKNIRNDAFDIIEKSIKQVLPDMAVRKALDEKEFNSNGKIMVLAIGKAAWNMAHTTKEVLGDRISQGLVVTKYQHAKGLIQGFEIIEAGHPIPDDNAIIGAKKALAMAGTLKKEDTLILLISGGGSALFEMPLPGIELDEIIEITNQLLSCGADIGEINTIRKHLSAVKGGRFAKACTNGSIFAIVLSDVIGDSLDTIASGPAFPDMTTSKDALNIIEKYDIQIEPHIQSKIEIETPKEINNCESVVTGSVTALCKSVAQNAKLKGYEPTILSTSVDGEAREVGRFFASIARMLGSPSDDLNQLDEIKKDTLGNLKKPCAIIAGGETVVRIMGKGKGGRNQELALAAALGIDGIENLVIFSLGSDGTDGPTDAAGGMVDGQSIQRMKQRGISPEVYLDMNDSYHALQVSNDLIMTGPTGTNVNDVIVLLCK